MVESECKKLKKFLDNQADRKEITTYLITEINKLPYLVYNLEVDYENGCIMFHDAEEIIREDGYNVLQGFLIDTAELKITRNNININFKSGNINIKVVG